MNRITVEPYLTPYGYEEYYFTIDKKLIVEYLDDYIRLCLCDSLKTFGSALGLCPTLGRDMVWPGDRLFVWELIYKEEQINLPILVCEQDLDFSCVVIVVKIRKDDHFVYWDRIGLLDHKNEDFEVEKQSGILCVEKYSQEDWKKYGKNIARAKVNSRKWCRWISENWSEELLRRRRNYTFPYLQNEENIIWINDTNFIFARNEYEECVLFYKQKL